MLILAVNLPPNLIHSVFKGKCFIESEWSNLRSKDQNTFIQLRSGLNCAAVAMLVPAVNPRPNLICSVFKGKCVIESKWSNLWSKDQNIFIQIKAGLNCAVVAMLVL